MTSSRRSAAAASRWMVVWIAAAFAAAPACALAKPADLFLERSAMVAVADRCGLFAPEVAAALAASAAQARGAALRAGVDARALQSQEREALASVAGLNCRSARVTEAAARVQLAFASYQKITRMTYRGDVADWRVDRGVGRNARWRLAQDVIFGQDRMTFGFAGREGVNALIAVADFADGARPYAARLVMRDTGRTIGPYLDTRDKSQPLYRKLPPRTATRSYLAEARSQAEAELAPGGSKDSWAFRFPAAVVTALDDLDPREAVAVEFLFAGERVRTAYLEVGDFTAGLAFLQMAWR